MPDRIPGHPFACPICGALGTCPHFSEPDPSRVLENLPTRSESKTRTIIVGIPTADDWLRRLFVAERKDTDPQR